MRRYQLVLRVFVIFMGAVSVSWSSTETVLHSFTGNPDGADPVADLVYDPTSGLLFGVTNNGGGFPACTKGCGTVFSVSPSGTYKVVYRFQGMPASPPDGANPQAGLVVDSAGHLYGSTYNGGMQNLGTVFKLTPSGGGNFQESIIFSFSGSSTGTHPLARLTLDSAGNLYGTSSAGGAHGKGTVFELTPSVGGPWMESVLFSFDGLNGQNPKAGVACVTVSGVCSAGSVVLWGTTYRGGASGLGTIFQLSNSGGIWTETFLHSFAGLSAMDGANPAAGVVLDNSANVYGTTQFGGTPTCTFAATGCGVVFELQRSGVSYNESVIYDFTASMDGAEPLDDLALETDGAGIDLYGTASEAGGACTGTGCGAAFVLCSPAASCGAGSWSISTLVDFTGTGGLDPGHRPAAGVILPPSGFGTAPPNKGGCPSACMGTASQGGATGNGVVVALTN